MLAVIPFPEISPEILSFELFGITIALRWYAMGYIVGIALGWQLIKMALNRPHLWQNGPPMQPSQLEDLLTYIVIGVIAGGRLGHALFYSTTDYLAQPLEIFKIWEGGLSFHGGFIGVILAVILFSRRHKVSLPELADIIAVAATPAILLVRIANFINGELYGRATDVPWAVRFPTMCRDTLQQGCAEVGGWFYYGNELPRHPSQLYEAGLEGLLLGTILILLAFRFGALKKHWMLTGIFFLGYGISRFLVEFVRQPDAQFVSAGNPLGLAFHIDGVGLTMGQTLTLPMILIGLTVFLMARRR